MSPLAISAKERTNLGELEERIEAHLPEGATTPRKLDAPEMKLAFVGRMNAGKSSLVNALLKDERMIVSEVPGTTRDTVDVRFEQDGRAIVAAELGRLERGAAEHPVRFGVQRICRFTMDLPGTAVGDKQAESILVEPFQGPDG